MRKSPPVTRTEVGNLRVRLSRLEAFQNEHGPKVAWATYQAEMSEMRLRTLEQWVDTLQRAIAANPEAFREVALAALAAKVEPWP
jgi:hypothetical protein